jgi:hypothetical protein
LSVSRIIIGQEILVACLIGTLEGFGSLWIAVNYSMLLYPGCLLSILIHSCVQFNTINASLTVFSSTCFIGRYVTMFVDKRYI